MTLSMDFNVVTLAQLALINYTESKMSRKNKELRML